MLISLLYLEDVMVNIFNLYTEPEAVVCWKNSADQFEVQAN